MSKNEKLKARSFMETDRLFLFCRVKLVLILILTFGFTAFAQSDNSISSDDLKKLFAEQNYEKLDKIVTKANVNSLFIEGESLLTKAIEKKDRRLFDMLLAKGMNVNLTK